MSVVTIIGAGMMGSAMSRPASDNSHEVRLVGTPLDEEIITRAKQDGFHLTLKRELPSGIRYFHASELEDAIAGSDLIIGGISSFGIDWFAENTLPKLQPGVKVLLITKGLRCMPDGNLVHFPHLLGSRLPEELKGKVTINAVAGPCICFELMDRIPTMVYYCGEDLGIVQSIADMFRTDYYHLTPSTDLVSVEGCAALKNAYALGISLAVGLWGSVTDQLHYNPQAALFGQCCREMVRIVKILGGNPELVSGHPFAGDLYVTVFGGRTRLLGTLLGQGKSFTDAKKILSGVTLESVAITQTVAQALRLMAEEGKVGTNEFPLLMHLDNILCNEAPADIPWELLR